MSVSMATRTRTRAAQPAGRIEPELLAPAPRQLRLSRLGWILALTSVVWCTGMFAGPWAAQQLGRLGPDERWTLWAGPVAAVLVAVGIVRVLRRQLPLVGRLLRHGRPVRARPIGYVRRDGTVNEFTWLDRCSRGNRVGVRFRWVKIHCQLEVSPGRWRPTKVLALLDRGDAPPLREFTMLVDPRHPRRMVAYDDALQILRVARG